MSADPAQFTLPFSHYARLGYLPVPLHGKVPFQSGWQSKRFEPGELEALDGEPSFNVGLNCENIVGLDIDLTDPKHAKKIEALIRRTLKLPKSTPRRVGNAPKCLLIMRVDHPLPGFDLRHARKTVLFQLLGAGKQFVVSGIHPDTQRPYTLNRPLPAVAKLPLLTPQGLVALREALTEGLGELGYEVGVASATGGPARTGWSGPPWTEVGMGQAAEALVGLDPDMDRLSWINVGMAIADGTHASEEGFALWDEWSSVGSKYNQREMLKQWRSFKPGGITRASLFKNNWLKREQAAVVSAPETEEYAPFMDWQALAINPPSPKRAIVKDWLYEGTVALFAGHGGVGKSFFALQLAINLALGRDTLGEKGQAERVIYYSCEDDAATIYWRAKRYCEHLGAKIEDLDERLLVRDFTQSNAIMYSDAQGAPNTDHQAMVLFGEDVANFGATVAFIDNASDVFSGSEIIRAQVRAFVRGLQARAKRCAVVLLAHVDKLSAKNPETSQGYSGSTAWNNSVRSRWYLYPLEGTRHLIFELQKSNYGRNGAQFEVQYAPEAGIFTAKKIARATDGLLLEAMLRAEEAGVWLYARKNAPGNILTVLKSYKVLKSNAKWEAVERVMMNSIQKLLVQLSEEVDPNSVRPDRKREVWVLTSEGKSLAYEYRKNGST